MLRIMDPINNDKPDNSSIKPVSSLRAQFEDISITKGTSLSTKGIKPYHLQQIEQERGRTALNAPDRKSSWAGPHQNDERSSLSPSTDAFLRSIPTGASVRQRPASVGQWSPPKSAPVVTIHSPMSPLKTVNALTDSMDAPRNDAQTSRRALNQQVHSNSPTRNDQQKIMGNSDLSYSSQRDLRGASPSGIKKPPPVNRASKPATPTVSGFKLGIGATDDESKDKISPFSTPPSSDSSPTREQSLNVKTRADPRDDNSSYFIRPPLDQAERTQIGIATRHERNTDAIKPNRLKTIDSSPSSPRALLMTGTESRLSASASARSHTSHVTSITAPIQPPRPSNGMKAAPPRLDRDSIPRVSSLEVLPPPPKRNLIPSNSTNTSRESLLFMPPVLTRTNSGAPALPARIRTDDIRNTDDEAADANVSTVEAVSLEAPDHSQSNRRSPKTKFVANRVWTQYDTRYMVLYGNYVCTGGQIFRAWDITNSRMTTDYAPEVRELKVASFVFKPGTRREEEGLLVWIGNNAGEIQEINIKINSVVETRPEAHGRREIIKMFRYQNFLWSLDDEGRLLIWPPGVDGVPSLRLNPNAVRVARGHSCSIIVKSHLWIASNRNIQVYNPMGGEGRLNITLQPLSQDLAADITCAAVISSRLDRVYFGHSDGKISIYSTENFTCLGFISASPYKINCLAGVGVCLWAGFNTGMIHVYDTHSEPWKVKKEWQAHQKHPISSIVVDLSSVWKLGHLQVASLGADNAICFWDGMLEDDWIENDMWQHDVEFCTFREISAAVMTWNAGASTPGGIRHDQKNSNFFREAIRMGSAPDILVFGFQELVDLEDKKLTAKSIFKGSKKKDSPEAEHMSHQYRAWRDYLTQLIEKSTPETDSYSILHTASMVGLFTCVFVKSHLRSRIRNLGAAEIKRGLGGLHGNKGAIILRFNLEDTSLCFTNCHLAAGQSQTASRNSDITAILEASVLQEETDLDVRMQNYVGGGDGTMIMDHMICIVNGDLNYRIDTMSRSTVIKAIETENLAKLLERDQLLVSKRRNPGFRLRSFKEQTITFPPTYKYDVGSDKFDTSEKSRSPAWCDRILYRGLGAVKQVDYKRHELQLSDHRPVSGLFLMRIRKVDQERRAAVYEQSKNRLADVRKGLARDIKLGYLVNVLGVQEAKARAMLDQ